MSLPAGAFDTKVRIERKVPLAGGMKAGQHEWAAVITEWAQVLDWLPSRGEQLADGLTIATRPARIRMRWRADIAPDMRIVIGSLDQPDDPRPDDRRYLQIVAGPAKLGMRDMEMMAAEYSTAGGEA
jgi:head-tail adaptor